MAQALLASLPIQAIDGGIVQGDDGDIGVNLVGGGHKVDG
jgi:hypothetical protein